MPTFFADTTALREVPAYRRYYIGAAVSIAGSQVTMVALPYMAYKLTGSKLTGGLVSFTELVPLILCSFIGGSLADAYDRRKMMLTVNLCYVVVLIGLVYNAQLDSPALWPLFVCGGLLAALIGLDAPARSAYVPTLVGRGRIQSAVALNMTLFHLGSVVGPALAGLVISQLGFAWAFALDGVTFLFLFAILLTLPPSRPEGGGTAPGWRSIVDGLAYLKTQPVIRASFLADIVAMVFGMPAILFPAIGEEILGGGPKTVGYLYSALAAGGLLAIIGSGWTARVQRPGLAVVWCIAVWGVAIVAFGFSRNLPMAALCLATAGAADSISALFRSTMVQTIVSDEYRGRLSSLFTAVVRGGPRLGDLEAGAAAQLVSVQFSVVSGGLACLFGIGVIAAAFPAFVAWRATASLTSRGTNDTSDTSGTSGTSDTSDNRGTSGTSGVGVTGGAQERADLPA